MKQQKKGRIINILTSYTIGSPPSSLSDYVTSKYAVLGLTKSLARELGKYNITVNAVSPGFIKNKFTKNIPEKFSEILISQTPLGRLTTTADIAKIVLFLCSDEADFITGENINLSGGQVME
jgi:NAD(P)-dependent dehydrogenase (short-subunit alcohol dehydrogenase family)